MSRLPVEFIGLWQRVELIVDDEIVHGAGQSWWFQGAEHFLDVRAAGATLQSEAFGGVTTWEADTATLRWSHDLDLHPDPSDDHGRVEWRDGDLIEHGVAEQFGNEIAFSEVWRRHVDPATPIHIAERTSGIGRMAVCGSRAAIMLDDRPDGAVRGGNLSNRGWCWAFDHVLGLPLERPRALPQTSDEFAAFGEQWRIIDRFDKLSTHREPVDQQETFR